MSRGIEKGRGRWGAYLVEGNQSASRGLPFVLLLRLVGPLRMNRATRRSFISKVYFDLNSRMFLSGTLEERLKSRLARVMEIP